MHWCMHLMKRERGKKRKKRHLAWSQLKGWSQVYAGKFRDSPGDTKNKYVDAFYTLQLATRFLVAACCASSLLAHCFSLSCSPHYHVSSSLLWVQFIGQWWEINFKERRVSEARNTIERKRKKERGREREREDTLSPWYKESVCVVCIMYKIPMKMIIDVWARFNWRNSSFYPFSLLSYFFLRFRVNAWLNVRTAF